MSPSPARVRVSGAHAALEQEAEVATHRVVNILIAGLALFIALPLLLLIAVAIKLSSRGPVLYTQERVGLDRRAIGDESANRRRTRNMCGLPFAK
jgi:lipopolysaccharide/colanic/teichoic acid biosynthesis glycosyltransferase